MSVEVVEIFNENTMLKDDEEEYINLWCLHESKCASDNLQVFLDEENIGIDLIQEPWSDNITKKLLTLVQYGNYGMRW